MRKRFTILNAIVMSTLLGSHPVAAWQDHKEITRLKLIAHSYQANRDAFSQLYCRFHINHAKAEQLADIPSGNLKDRFVAQGVWVVDGPRVRLELFADPNVVPQRDIRRPNGGALVLLDFQSSVYLGDSHYRLTASPTVGIANVHPPESYRGIQGTPFDMHWMGDDEKFNPAHVIQNALAKPGSCRYLGERIFEGKKVVSVEVVNKEGNQKYTFQMDPERAFWPIHTVLVEDGKPAYVYRITNIKAATNGQWYPATAYWISYPDGRDNSFVMREYIVDELRCGPQTGAKDFCVTLPKGCTINEPTTEDAPQFTLDKDTEYCLSDLPSLVARCRLIEEERHTIQGEATTDRNGRTGNFYLITGLIAVVLFVIAVVLVVRRRRHLASTQGGRE